MATEKTKCVIWGVKPIPSNIIGIPDGAKVRFRIRNTDCMRCFIRKDGETRHYVLVSDYKDGPWHLCEQGANVSHQSPLRPGTPQAKDHAKLIANL